MKAIRSALLGMVLAGVATVASAQNEQFIPMAGYWVGPYAAGGSGHLRRLHRLSQHDQCARRRRERRQAHVREVRDRVQQRARRRVLRAAQEQGPDGRIGVPHAVDRHHLLDHRQGDGRQDPGDLDRLRPHRRVRRPRVSVHLPAGDQLLVAEHRQDQVHRDEGRRDGQAQGQEDREHLSRFGLRQGNDPGARRAGEDVRLHRHAHPGAASGQRAGRAVAADPADQARLGDPARLGRDESPRRSRPRPRSASRAIA